MDNDLRVIVVGDSLLDRYYEGVITGIASDGPFPQINVNGHIETPGGAANVVMNLASLDVPCHFITALSSDEVDEGTNGIVGWFSHLEGVKLHGFPCKEYCVPILTRVCASNGQPLIRFDQNRFTLNIDATTASAIWRKYEDLITKIVMKDKRTAVVFSDYGRGMLGDNELLKAMLELAQILKVPTIVDPHDANLARYMPATIIKPNLRLARLACDSHKYDECASTIFKKLQANVKGVIVTAGVEGMALAVKDTTAPYVRKIPAYPPNLFANGIGAGDTVTAVLATKLACTPVEYDDLIHHVYTAARHASVAAGVVVMHSGTAVIKRWEYEAALADSFLTIPDKVADVEVAISIIEAAHEDGDEIVLANGCFDQLHPGHIHLLQEARRMGDLLVVALNSDESVKRLKGANRPIIPQEQRVKMLAALECVDLIVVFEEDTPEKLVRTLKPDLLVKGNEYFSDDLTRLPGAEYVLKNGKGVMFVNMLEGYSTTKQSMKAKDVFGED